MNANAQQTWPVLADAVIPVSDRTKRLARDVALVVAGCLFTALLAQVKIPLGFTPVPITGQTFAVLLVGRVPGQPSRSRRHGPVPGGRQLASLLRRRRFGTGLGAGRPVVT